MTQCLMLKAQHGRIRALIYWSNCRNADKAPKKLKENIFRTTAAANQASNVLTFRRHADRKQQLVYRAS